MVPAQLLTYLRNHIYFPHLDLLLYFTSDNHNGELVRLHLLIQTILEPHQISPLPQNPLHRTNNLFPQLPQKPLPDLLLQIPYIGLHNRPHYYLVPPPALLRLGGSDGVRIIS